MIQARKLYGVFVIVWRKRVNGFGSVNNFLTYPKAARMCKSLFPNNYLDVTELHDVERLGYANEEFFFFIK